VGVGGLEVGVWVEGGRMIMGDAMIPGPVFEIPVCEFKPSLQKVKFFCRFQWSKMHFNGFITFSHHHCRVLALSH